MDYLNYKMSVYKIKEKFQIKWYLNAEEIIGRFRKSTDIKKTVLNIGLYYWV